MPSVSAIAAFALLLVAPALGFSQPFSFGAKAGVPVTDFVTVGPGPGYTVTSSTTNRYIVGATFEVHLPFRLAAEVDVLYRHLSYRDGYLSDPVTGTTEHVTSGLLEFPLLLKYRFPGKRVRPFLDAGPTFDRLIDVTDSFITRSSLPYIPVETGTGSTPIALQNRTAVGFAIGGGLDLHAGVLRLSPELRYTYWASPHFFSGNQSRAELLFGITF